MTREEIIAANPISVVAQDRGAMLRSSGKNFITNYCPVIQHKNGHNCVSIDPLKALWRCADCDKGGSVIDWVMCETGKTATEAMEQLGGREVIPPAATIPQAKDEIEATYDYTNENGKLIFQALRYKPKTFRQRRPDDNGGWVWNLEGVERVLFNLPSVLTSKSVVVCEGEKDCLALTKLGWAATTSAGGSGGWLPAYGSFLKGKDVIVIPDSDAPGAKYADAIIASITDKANSIKRVSLPAKDASDYIASFANEELARESLAKLIDRQPHSLKPLPFYSLAEMEDHYRKFVKNRSKQSFDISRFLPSFAKISSSPVLFPGELVLVLADTGVGKSILLQTMARAAHPLVTLFFELELPLDVMFVRFVQMEVGCYFGDVTKDYTEHDDSFLDNLKGLSHITVCPESGLTPAQIENYIERSELKLGQIPAIVFVDYIGLVRAGGKNRYESVSDAAEAMKVIAKNTNTIVVMASQVSRPAKDSKSKEINLHDAKDSGALENSAGLVLGCWRPTKDKLFVKVLKDSKGGSAGNVIETNFDGAKMRISEDLAKLEFDKS